MLRQKVVVGGGVLSVSSQRRDSIPCFRSGPLRQLARPSIRFGGFLLDSSSSLGHSGLTSHDKCSNVLRFTCNSRWKKALRLERGDSSEWDILFLDIMSELDMTRSTLLTSIQTRPIACHLSRKNHSKRTTSGPTRFRLGVLLFLLPSSVGGLPATATNPWRTTLCYVESHDATKKYPILVSRLYTATVVALSHN